MASQTAGTELVSQLSPKHLLLLHGTSDPCLSHKCSLDLFKRAKEPKELQLFEGDGHGLQNNPKKMHNMLFEWTKSMLCK